MIEENGVGGEVLTWNLNEIELLAPGETVSIRYLAIPEVVGENLNIIESSAQCTYDPSITVTAEDFVVVNVYEP